MKKIKLILTFLISTLLFSCSSSDFDNIEGEWIAEGYNCENLTGLSEEIRIDKKGSVFYAIKLTGDNCIQAGDTTWYGDVKGDRIIGKIKGMNPQTRDFEWSQCEVYENMGFLFLSVDKYMVLKMKYVYPL
jgi:hypothetical protein